MSKQKRMRPACLPAADLDTQIESIAALSIDELRIAWHETLARAPPVGMTKDLIARALAYRIQEASLGKLSSCAHRILRGFGKSGLTPVRQVKVGSVIVRENGGVLHEVLVVPGGFCWEGRIYDSLSAIAKAITGTSWNGPRFFGLRGKRDHQAEATTIEIVGDALLGASRLGRRSSVGRPKHAELRGRRRTSDRLTTEPLP